MTRKLLLAPLLALGILAAPATALPQPQGEQASIAFANQGGIRDWQAGDRDTLYIQGRNRQWYEATLMAPSHDLRFAWAIGFDTGPADRLDRFSTVVIRGQRYPIVSLVKIEGPPPKRDRSPDNA